MEKYFRQDGLISSISEIKLPAFLHFDSALFLVDKAKQGLN